MKKVYQKPRIDVVTYMSENRFLEQSYDHADAKKQSFFDEEDDAQSEVAPTDKSTWDDEKNWD